MCIMDGRLCFVPVNASRITLPPTHVFSLTHHTLPPPHLTNTQGILRIIYAFYMGLTRRQAPFLSLYPPYLL